MALIISIASSSNTIGSSIGFLIPPGFIFGDHSNRKALTSLLITEASMSFGVSIVFLIFFRNSPNATIIPNSLFINCKEYKKLCHNKHFIIMTISSMVGLGNLGIFSTVIEALMNPFGYTSV